MISCVNGTFASRSAIHGRCAKGHTPLLKSLNAAVAEKSNDKLSSSRRIVCGSRPEDYMYMYCAFMPILVRAARTKAPLPPAGRRCAAKIGYPNLP